MISAEEIKALMAKDENGLLPCPFGHGVPKILNTSIGGWRIIIDKKLPDNGWQCIYTSPEFSSKNSLVEFWNTRAYTPALSNLQTLLNQVAGALRSGIEYSKIREEYQEEHIFPDLAEQALAAIDPYLTKEGV